MKHVVEAGTDGAALLLFDRGALPEAFDGRVKDDPVELFEELMAAGKACYLEPGGTGRTCCTPTSTNRSRPRWRGTRASRS